MLFKNHKKLTALALCGALSFSILGASMSVTEASSHKQLPPPKYEQEHHDSHIEKHHRDDVHRRDDAHHDAKESDKKYSEGERNTAAVVGAVVGYALGKVT